MQEETQESPEGELQTASSRHGSRTTPRGSKTSARASKSSRGSARGGSREVIDIEVVEERELNTVDAAGSDNPDAAGGGPEVRPRSSTAGSKGGSCIRSGGGGGPSKTESGATARQSPSQKSSVTRRDPLNTEFIYYSSMLKCLAPALTSETNRCRVIPWIRKLFGPEYQVEKFRSKRNKYLCSLAITLMNDEVSGVFKNLPPCGALYEVDDLACDEYEQAEWETDTSWCEMIQNLPETFFSDKCTIHSDSEDTECKKEADWSQDMLDQEFRLFLYLIRPYAALLVNPEEKAKVASWLQLLCCVPKISCVAMKSLRNDYMRSLYGCLHDLCVSFPFTEFAPSPPLPVPHMLAKGEPPKHRFTDPTSEEANEFLKNQPVPETGAFCYLALSGELMDSNLPLGEDDPCASEPKLRKKKRDILGSTRHVEIRSSRIETTAEVNPRHFAKTKPCIKNTKACGSRC